MDMAVKELAVLQYLSMSLDSFAWAPLDLQVGSVTSIACGKNGTFAAMYTSRSSIGVIVVDLVKRRHRQGVSDVVDDFEAGEEKNNIYRKDTCPIIRKF